MFVRLELGDLLLPVCVEDVAIVAREALVYLSMISSCLSPQRIASYILPRAGEQLRVWGVALGGNLDQISAGGLSAGARGDVQKQMRLGWESAIGGDVYIAIDIP